MSNLRRKIVGNKSEEFEIEESSYDPSVISTPFRIEYNLHNLKSILVEIMKYPRIGVLVANDEARERLISIIGRQAYDDYDVPFIFTVNEIKGMEYQYIVCIDIFTDFYKEWQEIIANDMSKKRETKYRFYFNLIYVALTRAQYHMCFMDSTPVEEIDSIIQLSLHNNFDVDQCYFSDLGNSLWDWYEQAHKHHENGAYDKAIKYYLKAGEYASPKDIRDCQIGLAKIKKDYNNLVKYALINADLELAKKYVYEDGVSLDVRSIVEWLDSSITKAGIVELIMKNFADSTLEDKESLINQVKTKLRKEAQDIANVSILAGGIPYDK